MIRKLFLLFFFTLYLTNINGQNPGYYFIGQKDLSNADIYSIFQTDDKKLYAGTNQGLFVYKKGRFINIPLPSNAHGNSVFELKQDNKGILYCCNLSGQIFRLVNDDLEIFIELPSKDVSTYIAFDFYQDTTIIIAAKSVIGYSNLTPNHKIKTYFDGYYRNFKKLPNNDIVFIDDISVEYKTIKNNKLKSLEGVYINKAYGDILQINNKTILTNDKGKILNHTNNQSQLNFAIFKQNNNDEAWAIFKNKGLKKITIEEDVLTSSQLLFPDHFISTLSFGLNGTIFLGTFGHGIITIPDPKTKKHETNITNSLFRGLAVDNNDNAFITTRDGEILHFKNEFKIIDNVSKVSLEKIYCIEGIKTNKLSNYNYLLYDNSNNLNLFNTNFGVLKDLFKINESTILLSSSFGVYKIGDDYNIEGWAKVPKSKSTYHFAPIKQRCRSTAFDTTTNKLYIATNTNLVCFTNGIKKEIRYNNNSLNVNELLFFQNKLYCATQNHGILVFKNDLCIDKISTQYGLNEIFIKKIEIRRNKLFASHKSGFYVLDLIKMSGSSLGYPNGIINGSISDFSTSKNKLWMMSHDALYTIDLNELNSKIPKFNIYINSFIFEDVKGNKTHDSIVPYSHNQLSINFDFRDIEYVEEIRLRYRIKGLEKKWHTISPTEGKINYNSLPTGNYKFEIQSIYNNSKQKLYSKPFTIKKPYWQKAWFIIGSILLLLSIIILIYKYNLVQAKKKQRYKTELTNSKLTALKSQMNPHFIFNALNSIQALVLKGDVEGTYRYITKFANMVRFTLNYSDDTLITFEKEIEVLELYLSLEKLRFKDKFEYIIDTEEYEDISIPPLMIQPFVENALRHGLLHKDGYKSLKISFRLDEKLICIIEDNGIGRTESENIKKRQNREHASFSTSAIKKRFELLKQEYNDNIGFDIIDLYDAQKPTGTKVVLTLPYKRNL